MSTYKLTYFNVRALGEITRILFHLAGQPFEDVRYPIDLATFSKPEYDADKATGKFAVNMDRIPILEVDGTFQLGQSKCIEKYVSKKFGFYGDSLEEECKIDMICEHLRDIKQKLNDAKAGKTGEEATAAKTKFITEELPGWFAKLERTLGGDKFAVGSKISLADVTIHAFVEDTADDKAAMSAAASGCPKVTGITANVAAAAKAWFDKRPVTAF